MLCLNDSIRYDDPSLQRLLSAVEDAHTLTALILAAWQVARVLAVHIVEAVLAARARPRLSWPPCPACGTPLRSKGFATRQVTSLFGPIRWRRRVGRCPGCVIPQVAPLDVALGVQPYQRTSGELQALGCALAVLCRLPRRPSCWAGTAGPPSAHGPYGGGCKRPANGRWPTPRALTGGRQGHSPLRSRGRTRGTAPLVIGADGVMVPFRPEGGQPGKTEWHEVKVGVLARLGQHRTRTGQVVPRLAHRRLVAVLGGIEALKARLWLEAVRQGILHAPRVVWLSDGARGLWHLFEERFAAMRPAFWTFTTRRNSCGRVRPPGSMAARHRPAGGSAGPDTACGMANPTGSWPTWPRP